MDKGKAGWVDRVIEMCKEGPVTAKQIGEQSGKYGPDSVTKLRAMKGITVEVVGMIKSGKLGWPIKLYMIRRRDG